LTVKWISVVIYYEPHGRRKRPKLELIDNDGYISVEYGLAPEEVRELVTALGMEGNQVPSPEHVTIWKLHPLGWDGPILQR
jgi:hypothetical protein